jgi:hypothetical protein
MYRGLLTASGARVEFFPEVVMTKLLVCLLFAAAVVAANPFVETYLSEISVDSAHQFVEIHCAPMPQAIDLSGWLILASSSACTLTCQLQYDEFLVIDSEALAIGDIGHGTLRLNSLGDSVFLLDSAGGVADHVHYPRYPTGHDSAPLPPSTGGIAFWNYDDAIGQTMNWYPDSTPTPGQENDDYSRIAGTVTGTAGITLDEAYVYASGANGDCFCYLYRQTPYTIYGLGAGKYEVKAYAYHQGQPYQAVYPESVSVGYSGIAGGVDFVFPATGVAETQSAPLLPLMRVSGRTLLLSNNGTAPVSAQLYNQIGSRVGEYDFSPFSGEKRIELPTTLAPGIYFAVAQKGTNRSTVKVVLW